MSTYSEKDIDFKIRSKFEKLGFYYFTSFQIEPFKTLFGTLIPDGSMIHENNLLIIENKKSLKQEQEALKQLLKFCQTVISSNWSGNIYCVFGCLECIKNFIYNRDSKTLIPETMKLTELLNSKFNKTESDPATLFHDLHNFIVQNLNTDDNNELCFLCLAVLITTMKINIHTTSDELLFTVIKDIIDKDLPELKTLIQTINHENISILAKKIYDLYAIAGKDVYLKLYQEFCKYSKAKDEKNIVLTPDWIVRIMTNELRLSETESKEKLSILDPCVGTGSLILRSSYSNSLLYGVDINRKMYVLCKGLFMLSNPEFKVFHGDVFKLNFTQKFDRIITNPPYSKKITGCHAIEFLIFSINHLLKKNGFLVAIFPTNQIKTMKTYQKYKEQIFNTCDILRVINLGKCFKGDAAVDCSVLVCQRTKKPNKAITRVYNMEFNQNIATKIPHKGMQFTKYGNEIIEKIINNEIFDDASCNVYGVDIQITNYEMDWAQKTNSSAEIVKHIQQTRIEHEITKCKNKILKYVEKHIKDKTFNLEDFNQIIGKTRKNMESIEHTITENEYKECKISDLFELVNKCNKRLINADDQFGEYPLVSATIKNNGVVKFIDSFDLDGEYLIIITNGFSKTGFTTYHSGKFSVTPHVQVLKPKISSITSKQLKEIAKNVSIKFCKTYNANNILTVEKLMNETLMIHSGIKLKSS